MTSLTTTERAYVELEYRRNSVTNTIKITADDNLENIEQIITGKPPSSSNSATRQTIQEAILDATRMELVRTAHERNHSIDSGLQRYHFFKQRNRSLQQNLDVLKKEKEDTKRYENDFKTPSRSTHKMIRQVAVKNARREMQVSDKLKQIETQSRANLERALLAESRIRLLESKLKSNQLSSHHQTKMGTNNNDNGTKGAAGYIDKNSNYEHEQQNSDAQNTIFQLQGEIRHLENKVSELLSLINNKNAATVTTATTAIFPSSSEKSLKRGSIENKETQPLRIESSFDPKTSSYHRITHINYKNEVDTLTEELRRVLLEFDELTEKQMLDQNTITELKEEIVRLKQLNQLQHW
jgi:hypothetical protein